jgi:hypothetical protein
MKIKIYVAQDFILPGRAKDLKAPSKLDNYKVGLQELGCGSMNRIDLSQDRYG